MEKIITYFGQQAKVACDEKCDHQWDGKGYHFVSYIGGGGMDDLIPDTDQTQEELQKLDEELIKNGKYLSGGCVSCSKCGKPFEPPLY